MIPDLYPVTTMVLTSSDLEAYPREEQAIDFFKMPSVDPVEPWRKLFAGIPKGVCIGANRKQVLRPGYVRLFLDVRGTPAEFADLADAGEIPLALVQKRDVFSAYVAMGNLVGADLEYEEGLMMRGTIGIDMKRLKKLLDIAA